MLTSTEEGAQRRLAAILKADVAGYSRLMAEDDSATVAALDACRALFRERIAAAAGRVVDMAGDSVLAVFESVLDAVSCAIAVQAALRSRNEALPEARRMQFRIGVNLGDVILQPDGTVYGDGVNIAARIESLADAGGVAVAGSVHDSVAGKIDCEFVFLGEQEVKNIARPVRVYRIGEGSREAAPAVPAAAEQASIVVLPFENMSGDPEQGYFSDGISEDIITDLSKVSSLLVIARNSAFAYKGRGVDVRQIVRELGVRHVLEGSVRKAGNRIRVTAQLIDGATGGHVWAERYDRELTDIFEVQDELTRQIVAALKLRLTPDERRRLQRRGTGNLAAYDLYLRGREQFMRQSPQAIAAARPLLEQAVALDPGFAAPLANLAGTHLLDFINGWTEDSQASLDRSRSLAERAVALDPAEPYAHFSLAGSLLYSRRVDEAIAVARRSIELDPNFAVGYAGLAQQCHYAGRYREALAYVEKAKSLDPLWPDIVLHFEGSSEFMLGHYERAADLFRQRAARNPDTDISRVWLAACLGKLGRPEEARAAWADALRVNPQFSIEQRRRVLPYKDPAEFEKVIEGLRLGGIAV